MNSLHSKFDEEGFRDFFLPHLNSISKSHSATGETFNKKGKTDILIQDGDGNNVFIAECKIWHGEKELQYAINQLIDRYVSWRDEHTALIIFNKNNDNFTQLVASARQAIGNHELFVKKINDSSASSTRYAFKNREDEEKHIQLELIIFNCKNKKLPPTMGIKHREDSGFVKFWALSKLSFGGQVRRSEMPYVS